MWFKKKGQPKNTPKTPVKTIQGQLTERRPLPMGVTEFEEWSDRIISGACIPGATIRSQKFALADMIIHLAPSEAFKEDLFFINNLRKSAANQVADEMRRKIRDEAKAELAAKEEAEKNQAPQEPVAQA